MPRSGAAVGRVICLPTVPVHGRTARGPNVGSFDPETGVLVPFFNPRTQEWAVHFVWEGVRIRPLTAEGRVTVKILRLNDTDRVTERQFLISAGFFGSDQ